MLPILWVLFHPRILHRNLGKVHWCHVMYTHNEDISLQKQSFPLDLIKVTENTPLFSAEEAARVIEMAEAEGVDKNEYKSGKYQLGGECTWTISWTLHEMEAKSLLLLL